MSGIPNGVQTEYRVVKFGMGGPLDNAIPVREDINGNDIGYLENNSIVLVPVSGYRKTVGNNVWVLFKQLPKYLGDNWTLENGHLFAIPEPEPPAPPAPVEDIAEVELMEVRFQPGGQVFLKFRKVM